MVAIVNTTIDCIITGGSLMCLVFIWSFTIQSYEETSVFMSNQYRGKEHCLQEEMISNVDE